MANIKQQLELEAQALVDEQRGSGSDIHEVIAKHASQNGYSDKVVRSLTWLVNRHAFKAAMLKDKKDELSVADAEYVLHSMGRLKAPQQKSASLPAKHSGMGIGLSMSKSASVDTAKPYHADPDYLRLLGSREMELKARIKAASALCRQRFETMKMMSNSIKRAGLDKSEIYREKVMNALPGDVRDLIQTAWENQKVASLDFTDAQYKMYAQRALVDTQSLVKAARELAAGIEDLAQNCSRLTRVRRHREKLTQE